MTNCFKQLTIKEREQELLNLQEIVNSKVLDLETVRKVIYWKVPLDCDF